MNISPLLSNPQILFMVFLYYFKRYFKAEDVNYMPVIRVDCSDMDIVQKEKLIKSLTKTASDIMGIPEAAYVVLLNEMNKDNIGVGGEMLSKKQH